MSGGTIARMQSYDSDQRRKLLKAFMKARDLNVHGWTQEAGMSDSALRDFLSGRNNTLTDRTYERLAAAAKVPAAVLRGEAAPPIPLHGYAGAGDVIHQFDGDEQPPLDTVEAPPGLVNAAAVIVKGDSMIPMYFDGDVLIYEQKELPPERALNRACIVKTHGESGAASQVLVKRLLKGSRKHRYHLVSVNPTVPTLEDRRVEWVARIRWVKRA